MEIKMAVIKLWNGAAGFLNGEVTHMLCGTTLTPGDVGKSFTALEPIRYNAEGEVEYTTQMKPYGHHSRRGFSMKHCKTAYARGYITVESVSPWDREAIVEQAHLFGLIGADLNEIMEKLGERPRYLVAEVAFYPGAAPQKKRKSEIESLREELAEMKALLRQQAQA